MQGNLKEKYAGMEGRTPSPKPAPQPPMLNPTSQEGDTYYMDPALLPEGYKCKVGDEITLKMAVKSKGSKIGLTPVEVLEENSGEDTSAGDEQEESH